MTISPWTPFQHTQLYALPVFEIYNEGAKYERAGFPIVCDSVVSEKKTEKNPTAIAGLALKPAQLEVGHDLKNRLEGFLRADLMFLAWQALREEITTLDAEPQYHCLSRHILKTMARIVGKAENFNYLVTEKKLPQSLDLSKKCFSGIWLSFPLQKW